MCTMNQYWGDAPNITETCRERSMSIKKSLRSGMAAAALTAIFSASALAAEFDFKLHHLLSAKAPAHTQMLEPWAKAVEENSGGRVSIEIFPAMSLGGKPPELVQQARDGVVDIVWTVNGYTPGLFPRTEVFELPTVYTNDPVATNLAMAEMFDEHLAQEYQGSRSCSCMSMPDRAFTWSTRKSALRPILKA